MHAACLEGQTYPVHQTCLCYSEGLLTANINMHKLNRHEEVR